MNAAVRLFPCRIAGVRDGVVDVCEQAKFTAHGAEEGQPLVEVGVLQLVRLGDVGLDIDHGEGVGEDRANICQC